MKFLLFAILSLFAVASSAAPFVRSTGVPAGITHCVFNVDGTDHVVAVAASTCQYDVAAVTVGAHNVTVKYRRVDAIWGDMDSPAPSPTLSFTRPAAPTVAPIPALVAN